MKKLMMLASAISASLASPLAAQDLASNAESAHASKPDPVKTLSETRPTYHHFHKGQTLLDVMNKNKDRGPSKCCGHCPSKLRNGKIPEVTPKMGCTKIEEQKRRLLLNVEDIVKKF